MIDYIGIKIRDENRLQQTIAIFEALRSVNNFFYARKCRKSKYRNGRHFYTKHSWFTTRGNKLDLAIFIPPPISKGIRLMALDLFCLFQSPSLLSFPHPHLTPLLTHYLQPNAMRKMTTKIGRKQFYPKFILLIGLRFLTNRYVSSR